VTSAEAAIASKILRSMLALSFVEQT
jgi:hypothetical protein